MDVTSENERDTGPLQADLDWCLAQAGESQRGALWRLAEPGRHLDANLVRLPPNASVPAHTDRDEDVLLLAVAGSGMLHTDGGQVALATHVLTWMPRGMTRTITAGPGGLAFVTVNRMRATTGLRIQLPTDPAKLALLEAREEEAEREFEGGEAACLLPRVCSTCGAVAAGKAPTVCPSCNTPWDA